MANSIKKIFACMLLIFTIFTLCSCKKPKLNLEEAADNLEDNGYSVFYNEDADDENPQYQESLVAFNENGDYLTIFKFTHSKQANLFYESIKLRHDYDIESTKLEIETIKNYLKKYSDDLSDSEIDAYEDSIDELEDKLDELKNDYCYGKSGKTVWTGNRDAIEDSRK